MLLLIHEYVRPFGKARHIILIFNYFFSLMDKVPIVFSDLDELWLAQPIVSSLWYYILVHGLVFLTLEYFVF